MVTSPIPLERTDDEGSDPRKPQLPVVPVVGLIVLFLWGGLKARAISPEVWFILSLLIPVVAYLNYKLVFFQGKRVTLSGMIVLVTAIAVAFGFASFIRGLRVEYRYEVTTEIITDDKKIVDEFKSDNLDIDMERGIRLWAGWIGERPKGFAFAEYHVISSRWNRENAIQLLKIEMDRFESRHPNIEFGQRRYWLVKGTRRVEIETSPR